MNGLPNTAAWLTVDRRACARRSVPFAAVVSPMPRNRAPSPKLRVDPTDDGRDQDQHEPVAAEELGERVERTEDEHHDGGDAHQPPRVGVVGGGAGGDRGDRAAARRRARRRTPPPAVSGHGSGASREARTGTVPGRRRQGRSPRSGRPCGVELRGISSSVQLGPAVERVVQEDARARRHLRTEVVHSPGPRRRPRRRQGARRPRAAP